MCHADEQWAEALPLVLLWDSRCMEGLESLIYRTSVRFSPAVTGRLFRPFTRRMHRHHRLQVLTEDPHWKASVRTSIPACCAIRLNFQGPGHRLAFLSTAWCLPGSPPSHVCRTIQGPPQERKDLYHKCSGRCENSFH